MVLLLVWSADIQDFLDKIYYVVSYFTTISWQIEVWEIYIFRRRTFSFPKKLQKLQPFFAFFVTMIIILVPPGKKRYFAGSLTVVAKDITRGVFFSLSNLDINGQRFLSLLNNPPFSSYSIYYSYFLQSSLKSPSLVQKWPFNAYQWHRKVGRYGSLAL